MLEGFYNLGEEISAKLIEIGVKSKKIFLSNPENVHFLLENLKKTSIVIPPLDHFELFYKNYWQQVENHSKRSQVSKTRIDLPQRMYNFLKTNGVEIERNFLNDLAKEIKNFVIFLQNEGLLLDDLSKFVDLPKYPRIKRGVEILGGNSVKIIEVNENTRFVQ